MDRRLKKVVVVGGGAAGWITAGLLAAAHRAAGLEVTLIESPDVDIIGVGEGTWPTMRGTLARLGVREQDFLRACDASFKQGTRFRRWTHGGADDAYYHPFTLPQDYLKQNLAAAWPWLQSDLAFAEAVSPQAHLCGRGLAPKQAATPDYAFVVNYGYHLDAGKFAKFLTRHCTTALGVRHVRDHVTGVNAAENGDIASLSTKNSGALEGDLFIDCTGFSSLLLRKHYGVRFVSQQHVLFLDRALAAPTPYADEASPIASVTLSTAQSAGWIWDIGLPTRQGVGYVYSSAHISDERAEEELAAYISALPGGRGLPLTPRRIRIAPGHLESFWVRNSVAVGLSAGFVEPLEASALVMIELSAQMLADHLPASRAGVDFAAQKFNEKFRYHWGRVIDFLKLHYVLSRRADSDFWIDNRRAESIPERLRAQFDLWRTRAPWLQDFDRVDETFSAASYQYVLYGMGAGAAAGVRPPAGALDQAKAALQQVARKKAEMAAALPTNRALLGALAAPGAVGA